MIQMIMMGLLVVFVGAVAYQWEQFNRQRRIDEGLESPGPVGRYQPIDSGGEGIVILDTATGRLWQRPRGGEKAAWEEWTPPVRRPEPSPASKPPAWDEFGPRPTPTSRAHVPTTLPSSGAIP
ncbi:hypothetical protein TA3x_002306 [Tundrisphaera sp. TA3]|uniref:hypothetical protein n=1 Tax=Tundrisphaera sp. TA3 TaxID=3435775 RepID=UPI003EB9632C